MTEYGYSNRSGRRSLVPLIAAGVALLLLGIPLLIGFFGSFSSTEGGYVGVVRNGGWLDDKNVRQVDGQPQILPPGSGLTSTGWYSSLHEYPSTQRYFKVSAAPGADSNEVINVPSKDGVNLGVEGTFYFTMNQDAKVLEDFDNKFGARTFPSIEDGEPAQLHPWEGEAGWSGFLNGTQGNLVQNVLREEVGKVNCPDLIATCVLAQPQAQNADTAAIIAAAAAAQNGQSAITTIQDEVNKAFEKDVLDNLGGPYFTGVKFVLSKVSLPQNVQDKINEAQGSYTDVTKAQARTQTARLDADAQVEKQRGYLACPVCAEIDKKKALPQGLTTYVEAGSNTPLAVTGR